jgi:hypothetical protein
MKRFCNHYAPLPIVMAASGLSDVPNVRVDSFGGMQAVVNHLIESHDLTRLVFITGPEEDREAQDRLRAYRSALDAHGIDWDPTLVVSGNFMQESGTKAVTELLDAHIPFDGVVAANDAMAVGAYRALQAYGLRVPDDVALAGFDDAPEARIHSVPLTTASQSFYELAHHIGDTVWDLIQGGAVPSETILASSLVVRRSCGCMPSRVFEAAVGPHGEHEGREEPFVDRHRPEDLPAEIWRAFVRDLSKVDEKKSFPSRSESPAFLVALEKDLRQRFERRESIDVWQALLTDLRCAVVPHLEKIEDVIRAEDLLQQARLLISEAGERRAYSVLSKFQMRASLLRTLDAELDSVGDWSAFVPVIQDTFPKLGIDSCYLVRWEPNVKTPAQLVVAVDGLQAEREDRQFSVLDGLLPEMDADFEAGDVLVVLPLTTTDAVLGYAVVDWGPQDGGVYRRLAARFSNVLHRFRLLEESDLARRRAEETLEEIVNTRSAVEHIQKAVDSESVLRITLEELIRVFGAKMAVARLGTREQLLDDGNEGIDG